MPLLRNATVGVSLVGKMHSAWLAVLLVACGQEEPLPPTLAVELTFVPERDRVTPMGQPAPLTEVAVAGAPPGGTMAERRELTVAVSRVAALLPPCELESPFEAAHPAIDWVALPNSDRSAIEQVVQGRAGAAVVALELSPDDRAKGLMEVALGNHTLVIAVRRDSAVRSLTERQMRLLLTGALRDWSEVAYQRGKVQVILGPEGPLLERAAAVLIPGDAFDPEAPRLGSDAEVVARVARDPMAVGVVAIEALNGRDDVRAVAVDGVTPDRRNVATKLYPYTSPLVLVHRYHCSPVVRELISFVQHRSEPEGWR